MLDTRSVAGVLQIHSEIDQVDDDLDVSLRLHGPTHDAEAHPGLVVARDESRNDGVERPLLRRIGVWMPFFEREHLTPVLKGEAKSVWHHAAAKSTIIALDDRNHIAFGIRRGEVHCVAFIQRRRAWII